MTGVVEKVKPSVILEKLYIAETRRQQFVMKIPWMKQWIVQKTQETLPREKTLKIVWRDIEVQPSEISVETETYQIFAKVELIVVPAVMIGESRSLIENASAHHVSRSVAIRGQSKCRVEVECFQRIKEIDLCSSYCEESFYRQSVEKTETKMDELSESEQETVPEAKYCQFPQRVYTGSITLSLRGHVNWRRGHIIRKEMTIAASNKLASK